MMLCLFFLDCTRNNTGNKYTLDFTSKLINRLDWNEWVRVIVAYGDTII